MTDWTTSRRQRRRRDRLTFNDAPNTYATYFQRRHPRIRSPGDAMATLTVMTQAHLPPPSSTSSTTSPPRRKRTNSRLQAWHDGADKQQQGRGKSRKSRQGGVKRDPPPLIRKVGLAAQIYSIQGVMGTVVWFQGWREWLYPPNGGPDIVKAYECRPGMGVRYVNGPFPNSALGLGRTVF